MIYALIKDGKVVNTIVADAEFVTLISSQYDECIRIDELPEVPGIGWEYIDSVFTNPNVIVEEPPVEE